MIETVYRPLLDVSHDRLTIGSLSKTLLPYVFLFPKTKQSNNSELLCFHREGGPKARAEYPFDAEPREETSGGNCVSTIGRKRKLPRDKSSLRK